ncbi:MAG: hypothetical protein HY650_12585, partial [Acidobacteria bacterium]|nr:hypothetical protein [Acidobacteriota bacterium]
FQRNEAAQALGHASGQRDIVVIAQEVETVFPELVHTSDTDGYKAVDYSRLPAVLIEAVKELKAGHEALKAENEALRTRLEALERLVRKLTRTQE